MGRCLFGGSKKAPIRLANGNNCIQYSHNYVHCYLSIYLWIGIGGGWVGQGLCGWVCGQSRVQGVAALCSKDCPARPALDAIDAEVTSCSGRRCSPCFGRRAVPPLGGPRGFLAQAPVRCRTLSWICFRCRPVAWDCVPFVLRCVAAPSASAAAQSPEFVRPFPVYVDGGPSWSVDDMCQARIGRIGYLRTALRMRGARRLFIASLKLIGNEAQMHASELHRRRK